MKRKTQLLLRFEALGMSVEEQKADIAQAIQYAKKSLQRAKANVCPSCNPNDRSTYPYYSTFARRYTVKWWRDCIRQHEEELAFLESETPIT